MGNREVIDSMIHDGLWDPYENLHMGSCAERCARKFGFSREQQDAYAAQSFRRANAAQADGRLAREIAPFAVTDRKGAVVQVDRDEGPAKVNYGRIPTLLPAFDSEGTITAGNASGIGDGAAALVLSTAAVAQASGWKPIARIASFGAHAQDPMWFTTAPATAAGVALKRAGWSASDVDLWEVNEAFAVVPMAFIRDGGVPPDKMNVWGGAIALGHPIGASGARILVTLLSALSERGAKRGLAATCIGGGEAMAVCVELL
jgi:acetyl-CoA C-acetyltransferase